MRAAAGCAFGAALVALAASMVVLSAQRGGTFAESRDHPAIRYSAGATTDPVAKLAARVQAGQSRLTFDPDNGYLRGVLEALRIPVESQVTVFSGTSNQAALINPRNPRALYFNDSAAVGWVRGSDTLEVASVDPTQGVILYSLSQKPTERPAFRRDDETCLTCHLTWDTLGVPGLVMMSTFSIPADNDKYSYAAGAFSDHRSSFTERWGGWYVTGKTGALSHLGNDTDLTKKNRRPTSTHKLDSLSGLFDARGFLTPHSDVVALMTLEHQATMTNLITRTGWEARVSAQPRAVAAAAPGARPAADRVHDAAVELVDYLLFVDEAPLVAPVTGSSQFAQKFAGEGPRDKRGRSLRQFDLEHRLMRYPCSYLIYSDAFEQMPRLARDAVYERMWRVLSGQEQAAPYDRFSRDDRRAVVDILLETKPGLPDFFKGEFAR